MPEKIIGILGGMGPEATIDLFTKIVKGTRVRKDQDHLRILIDNNPKIPDRTLAIQGEGPSPLNQLT
jgi:aspartate racemase